MFEAPESLFKTLEEKYRKLIKYIESLSNLQYLCLFPDLLKGDI